MKVTRQDLYVILGVLAFVAFAVAGVLLKNGLMILISLCAVFVGFAAGFFYSLVRKPPQEGKENE